MTPFEKAEFFTYLHRQAYYTDIREVEGDRYVAIMPLLYTSAIIRGRIGDTFGYDDRWCYHGYEAAKQALDAWDGASEAPDGWHRSPTSRLRREVRENGEIREFYAP